MPFTNFSTRQVTKKLNLCYSSVHVYIITNVHRTPQLGWILSCPPFHSESWVGTISSLSIHFYLLDMLCLLIYHETCMYNPIKISYLLHFIFLNSRRLKQGGRDRVHTVDM